MGGVLDEREQALLESLLVEGLDGGSGGGGGRRRRRGEGVRGLLRKAGGGPEGSEIGGGGHERVHHG